MCCAGGQPLTSFRKWEEPWEALLKLNTYKRLTPLDIMTEPLGKNIPNSFDGFEHFHTFSGDLKNVEPGDAIVCFSKADIYKVTQNLERLGIESAVIYGSLPAGLY